MVLEFLGSSVDVVAHRCRRRAVADRLRRRSRAVRPPAEPAAAASATRATPATTTSRTAPRPRPSHQPVKVDNELYVRDYSKCILCYKCVEACGVDAQNTFAIAVAGRGFDARISTEFDVGLPDSACVYCGNCIGVCPTGALMFTSEHEMREAGTWDESRADRDRDDLPVLRRRLRPRAPRAGQRDREGHLALGQRRHERPPVHQGPVRVPVRAEPRRPSTDRPRADVDLEPTAVTGVVLAGGRSTRFGRDKLAEPYRGMPMLQHAVLRLGEVCSEVIVGPRSRRARTADADRRPGAVRARSDRGRGSARRGPRGAARRRDRARAGHRRRHAGPADPGAARDAAGGRGGRVDAVALQDGDGSGRCPSVVRTASAVEVAHALLHDGRRALRDLLDALRLAVVDEPRGSRSTPSAEPVRRRRAVRSADVILAVRAYAATRRQMGARPARAEHPDGRGFDGGATRSAEGGRLAFGDLGRLATRPIACGGVVGSSAHPAMEAMA